MTLSQKLLLILPLLVLLCPAGTSAQTENTLLKHGEYVFRISGCSHCHTAEDGEPLGGGRPLETPFGTFYTPNISAHKTAGIGTWSEEDLRQALRHGVSPDGADYYPAFPYTSYTRMHNDDLRAMHVYILSLPASAQANRPHELAWFLRWRFAAKVWKLLFFDAGEYQPELDKGEQWNRGAYIAEAMGHCAECHTPRSRFGTLNSELAYAGTRDGPDGELVPNITTHKTTGIGRWDHDELREFLKFGELPDGEYAAGSMDPVIEGIRHLTPQDLEALIIYLRALPPIDNKISG